MDRLKRFLGSKSGKDFIEKAKAASTRKVQVVSNEDSAETFLRLIDKWSSLSRNSLGEKECTQEIINLCFDSSEKDGKNRKVKDICTIGADYSIFWKIFTVYILIPKDYELREILEEILSASDITRQDWEKAQIDAENITLKLSKK